MVSMYEHSKREIINGKFNPNKNKIHPMNNNLTSYRNRSFKDLLRHNISIDDWESRHLYHLFGTQIVAGFLMKFKNNFHIQSCCLLDRSRQIFNIISYSVKAQILKDYCD